MVSVLLARGRLSRPNGCTKVEDRFKRIELLKVSYQPLNPGGTARPSIDLPWTEFVDAVSVFGGPEVLGGFDREGMHFLPMLNGSSAV